MALTITVSIAHEGQTKEFPIKGLCKDDAIEIADALRSGALRDLVETSESNYARLSGSVLRGLVDHAHPQLAAASLHMVAIPNGDDATARARLTDTE